MKKYISILLLFSLIVGYAQSFDRELEQTAQTMAKKLNTKQNSNVAVYPFYDKQNLQSDLSQLVSEDFSIYLNQYNTHYKVMDRAYLDQMLAEHQLNEAGLINPETAKQFGMLIAADVYITGKTYVFPTYIRLQVVAIDTETGERLFSDYKRIPMDYDIAEFVGITDFKERKDKEDLYKSSNPKCAEQGVGDYCFINTLNTTMYVRISDVGGLSSMFRTITIPAKEKACFKNLSTKKSYQYSASKSSIVIDAISHHGEFEVQVCKSNYYTIR